MIQHRTVWQTAKLRQDEDIGQWIGKNEGWEWKMLGDRETDEWIRKTFGVRKNEKGLDGEKEKKEAKSEIEQGWDDLGLGILRSDAWRYLVLA